MNKLILIATFAIGAAISGEDFSKYVWEFPEASQIQIPADKQWMIETLREEVGKILGAGHLAPRYFNSGDLHHEGYFLYVAPGRIVTTLAWAWPHLTDEQRGKVKEYVAKELSEAKYAPWGGAKLPWNEGAGREGFDKPKAFNFDRWWGMEGQHRPSLHTFYGLWLYAHRSGDWETIKKQWDAIKKYYLEKKGAAELYSEFGAHIAVARLAHKFGDAETESAAVSAANAAFTAGLDYAGIEQASLKYFNRLKEKRHNFLRSTHFMLMNMSPETGRFLKEHVKDAVLAKNTAVKNSYPHWWLIAPAYGSWAGNIGPDCEASGLPREIFGMIYPVERWVAETPAAELAKFMSSGADGVGDCFWLEGLVGTIEAFGKVEWKDVR